MHIADGVLSTPIIAATSAAALASVAIGLQDLNKKDDEDSIPRIALMSGTFFAISLLQIKVPPSSVHPLLCGLIGIILGRRAALAFFPALLLQALLFSHGGLTSLGANTFMLYIPAIISHILYRNISTKNTFIKGTIVGGLSVCITVIILIGILFLTNPDFGGDGLSVIKVLVLTHLPLVFAEGLITGGAVQFLEKTKPEWIA